MKKLVLIGMVVAAVACGKEDDGETKCDSFCNGALKSSAGTLITSCLQYDSNSYTGGNVSCNLSTCEVNTSACVEATFDGEGEPCTGTGQGSCEAGLVCVELDPETGSICMEQCDPSNDQCGAGSYCIEFTSGGVCIEAAAHGEMCYSVDSENACSETGDYCLPMLSLDLGACSTECEPTDVNTASTCGAGEMCLATSLWVFQPVTCTQGGGECGTGFTCQDLTQYGYGWVCASTDSLENIVCTPETSAECNTAGGYECVEFTVGPKCAINYTICAESVPFWDGTEDAQGYIPESYYCGYGAALCGVTGATGTPAEGMCAPVFGDDYPFGVCVGFCEDDAGTELDCGTGYSCVQPAADDPYAIYWNVEEDAEGNSKTCTEATVATDCGTEYQNCKNFGEGLVCARPMKVCQPTP